MDLTSEKWTYTDGVQLYGEGRTPEEARQSFLEKLYVARDELVERIGRIEAQIANARRV